MYHTTYASPIGYLEVQADERGITCLAFVEDVKQEKRNDILVSCRQQLDEYFIGKRKYFDLPLCPTGTQFQKRVWDALLQIPYGETCTYGDIAKQCDNIKACRAVGMANHRNPIPILIPCHRVIGANHKLVGYGGGLDKKIYLLELEKKYK